MIEVHSLERALEPHLESVGALRNCCSSRGQRLAIVGGAIRDGLAGREIRDLDFVVEGDARDIVAELARLNGGVVRAHAAFGTATWVRRDGRMIDLASARTELYPRPGSLPVVRSASLEEDLARRDFTVNAMAFVVDSRESEPLLDMHGGLEDLKRQQLRILHSQSFCDDPTRVLRALRFACRLSMNLEASTDHLLKETLADGGLEHISLQRLGAELQKTFGEETRGEFIKMGLERGLWSALSPELEGPRLRELQELRGAVPIVWLGMASLLEEGERKRLISMIPGGARAQRQWMRGDQCVRQAMSEVCLSEVGSLRSQVGRTLEKLEAVELDLLIERATPIQGQWVNWWRREGRAIETSVDGRALQKIGIAEGPAIGRAKEAALDSARDGASAAEQLARARAAAGAIS